VNWLLDAIGDVGYALDTPGAYARGLLAGRPGERASGEELLSSYGVDGGPLGGMAAEMVLDPLALAGPAFGAIKGVRGINRGTRALAGLADDVNPVLGTIGRFADEGGWVDPARARELLESGLGPLGRADRLASSASSARVDIDPEVLLRQYGRPGWKGDRAYAMYSPGYEVRSVWNPADRSNDVAPTILPNLNYDAWGDDAAMRSLARSMDRPSTIGDAMLPDYVGTHEVGHAIHADTLKRWQHPDPVMGPVRVKELLPPDAGAMVPDSFGEPESIWKIPDPLRRDIVRSLGPYATSNLDEFVAEGFAREALGKPLPRALRDLYDQLLGPDPAKLPPGFWDVLGGRR
jgi:hypothetical protein